MQINFIAKYTESKIEFWNLLTVLGEGTCCKLRWYQSPCAETRRCCYSLYLFTSTRHSEKYEDIFVALSTKHNKCRPVYRSTSFTVLCVCVRSKTHSEMLSCISLNPLKPTGHVMYQQFNIQQLYVLPTLYLCVLYLSENKQQLVPLTA